MADHLSIEEAAERLSTTPDDIRARLADGRLEAVEVDGETRVDTVSVITALTESLSSSLGDLSRTLEQGEATPSASAGSVLAAVGIPLLLVLWALFAGVEMLFLADDPAEAPVPAWAFLVGSAVLLAALAAWARSDGQLGTSNGAGVTLHGRRETEAGTVGTAWLVLFLIPLVSIRSYVVHDAQTHVDNPMVRTTRYSLSDHDGLCWPQVLPMFLGVWGGLGALGAWFVLG